MDNIYKRISPHEAATLTEMLLKRLNTSHTNDCNSMKCYQIRQRRVDHLANTDYYRLLFLLEGKIYLKSQVFGKYLLSAKEMMMLPAGSEISCSAFDESKLVLLDCTQLSIEGNISYMEELKEITLWDQPEITAFPIHDKLEKLLSGFFAYTTHESRYPAVYDAVFILLRSLYTPRELASLFNPMLCCREKQRMYEEPQT